MIRSVLSDGRPDLPALTGTKAPEWACRAASDRLPRDLFDTTALESASSRGPYSAVPRFQQTSWTAC
jgi:hypothetical protein